MNEQSITLNEYTNLQFEADAIISLGNACRPAHALQRNNLRYFSSPFDWMMNYSLDSVIYFLENGFESFFKEYTIKGKGEQFHLVQCIESKMIAMHSFPVQISVEQYYPSFIAIMSNRLERLLKIFNLSKIFFISNRNNQYDEITNFICYFAQAFKKQCTYINIVDSTVEKVTLNIIKDSLFYNIYFDDVHPKGRNKVSNPAFWLGNVEKWNLILKPIILNKIQITSDVCKEDSDLR